MILPSIYRVWHRRHIINYYKKILFVVGQYVFLYYITIITVIRFFTLVDWTINYQGPPKIADMIIATKQPLVSPVARLERALPPGIRNQLGSRTTHLVVIKEMGQNWLQNLFCMKKDSAIEIFRIDICESQIILLDHFNFKKYYSVTKPADIAIAYQKVINYKAREALLEKSLQ